jgi:hypothetical protein
MIPTELLVLLEPMLALCLVQAVVPLDLVIATQLEALQLLAAVVAVLTMGQEILAH